jgi:hypothetical protein
MHAKLNRPNQSKLHPITSNASVPWTKLDYIDAIERFQSPPLRDKNNQFHILVKLAILMLFQ